MRTITTTLTALGLSALLAASPFLGGCAQATQQPAEDEEMERDASGLMEADDADGLFVDLSEDGNYTVSFAESDLMSYGEAAAIAPEVAVEGEGLSRDMAGVDAAVDEELVAEDTPVEAVPDEAAEAADELGVEVAEDKRDVAAGVAAEPIDAPRDFASLTVDDVAVLYNAPALDGGEAEVRDALVTSLQNDGATITVSFTNPDAGAFPTYYYTVVAGELGNAVFEVVTPAITEPFEGEAGEEPTPPAYVPDFSNEDIALPEGLEATDEGIVLTDEATDQVAMVVEGVPGLVEDMAREAGEKSYAEYRKEDKYWNNFDATVNYTVEDLKFVSKEASNVAAFGQAFYQMFKGIHKGNVASFMQGATGLLKLLGVVESGPEGVTNEDIREEIASLREDVAELRQLTSVMYDELDKAVKQTYANGLQTFDNALFALNTNATLAENIFQNGYELAVERGLRIPGEGATAEEEHEFNDTLVALLKSEEASGNSRFRDFSQIITDLRQNFTAVAGELSKSPEFSPLTAYKGYWNTYFNYESQSWWLRQAYHANAEYQVKRAFAVLAVYYNIGGTSGGTYDQIAQDLLTALTGMDGVPLGACPTDINVEDGRRVSVYSGTLNRTISTVRLRLGSNSGKAGEPKYAVETLQRLVTKCHGRSIKQDMQLAGLWSDGPFDRFDTGGGRSDYGHGLGFNTSGNDSRCYVTLIDWKGNIHSNTMTYNEWNPFTGYDGKRHSRVNYVYFSY